MASARDGTTVPPKSNSKETPMFKTITAATLTLFGAFAVLSASEIVVLKGGKTLELSKPYVVRGAQALMTLKDGTLISVATRDIDTAATTAARRTRPASVP